jgi:hypothetical protein
MTLTNRVVWQEGMSLRTQYCRHPAHSIECLVRRPVHAAQPRPSGSVKYALNRKQPGSPLRAHVDRHRAGTFCGGRDSAGLSEQAGAIPARRGDRRAVLLRRRAAECDVRSQPGDARCRSVPGHPAVAGRHRERFARPAKSDTGEMARRSRHQQHAAGFRSAVARCHRGSAGEWTRCTVPPARRWDAAIEMTDVGWDAASIGPLPDAVRWPLLPSGRGLRA